jgi:chemotaxis-related protein WspB
MLFLMFQIGSGRFLLDVAGIVAVLPLVEIAPIPRTPTCVAGLFNYRGVPVPAIDLSALVVGRPAPHYCSTRIVLVPYQDAWGEFHDLGLIAEKATQTVRANPQDFSASGIDNADVPYLGPVMADAHGMLQRVDAQTLLPRGLRDMLFQRQTRH